MSVLTKRYSAPGYASVYERWTAIWAGGVKRSFFVKLASERSDGRISGYKVDNEGDEIGGARGERHLVIADINDPTLIRTRLVVDRKYGTLRNAKKHE